MVSKDGIQGALLPSVACRQQHWQEQERQAGGHVGNRQENAVGQAHKGNLVGPRGEEGVWLDGSRHTHQSKGTGGGRGAAALARAREAGLGAYGHVGNRQESWQWGQGQLVPANAVLLFPYQDRKVILPLSKEKENRFMVSVTEYKRSHEIQDLGFGVMCDCSSVCVQHALCLHRVYEYKNRCSRW